MEHVAPWLGTLRRALLRGLVLGTGLWVGTIPAALGVSRAFGGYWLLGCLVGWGLGLVVLLPPTLAEG
ncbi:MAG: hypothetical protein AB7N76_21410 [Planctomycetota bacterium]